MLHNRLPSRLRSIGFNDAQVDHAMRIGGPLDEIRHQAWCDSCSRSRESTLREILAVNARCKCGGSLLIGASGRDVLEHSAGYLIPDLQRSSGEKSGDLQC